MANELLGIGRSHPFLSNLWRTTTCTVVATLLLSAVATAATIDCGVTTNAAIVSPTETDTFTFAAHSGEVVSITAAAVTQTSGTFFPYWELFAPEPFTLFTLTIKGDIR